MYLKLNQYPLFFGCSKEGVTKRDTIEKDKEK